MLSKEFLKEAPQVNPATGEAYTAAERDAEYAKNQAQGQKNLQGLKDFGSKIKNAVFPPSVSLADGPADAAERAAAASGYTGIDPIVRQRAGMAPATQQEINRYMKDNPAVVGGLTDRNGNPVASGGAQEVEKAARAAAPRRGADFDADAEVGAVDPAVIGNRFKTPNELGFQPGGSTAPTPAAPAAAPAAPAAAPPAPSVQTSPVPASKIQATPLPAQKAFSEPADDSAAKAYAAADADRQPVKAAGENDEIEQMKKNAGLPKTEKAINPETGEEYDKLATDDGPEQLGYSPDELEQMKKNAGLPKTEKAINPETGEEYDKLSTAQSAAGDAPAANPMSQDPAQRAAAAAAAPLPVRPGQQTSGTFGQQFKSARDQGLKTFSYQGKSYSTAMKGETPAAPAKPAAAPAANPMSQDPAQRAAAKPAAASTPVAAAKPAAAPATTAAKLPAPQVGAAGQAARAAQVNAIVDKRVQQSADRNVAQSAASGAPVTGGGPKVDRSTFESREINRMRLLAGLNKD